MSKALVLVGYMRRSADDHTHPAQQRYILLECVAAAAAMLKLRLGLRSRISSSTTGGAVSSGCSNL